MTEKHRTITYWSTMIALTAMVLATYSHSKEMERLVDDTLKKSNRQMQLTVNSYHKQIILKDKKIELLEQHILFQREHHMKEIGECVLFYTTALEEAKNEND